MQHCADNKNIIKICSLPVPWGFINTMLFSRENSSSQFAYPDKTPTWRCHMLQVLDLYEAVIKLLMVMLEATSKSPECQNLAEVSLPSWKNSCLWNPLGPFGLAAVRTSTCDLSFASWTESAADHFMPFTDLHFLMKKPAAGWNLVALKWTPM